MTDNFDRVIIVLFQKSFELTENFTTLFPGFCKFLSRIRENTYLSHLYLCKQNNISNATSIKQALNNKEHKILQK